jgi:HD-GYP domain-containing protein (c-di-GMP phosphodiesterase class II)
MNSMTQALAFCSRNTILGVLAALAAGCLAAEFYQLDMMMMVVVLPVLAATVGFQRSQAKTRDEKNRLVQELSRMHSSTIQCLVKALDAKDQGTHDHIRRVEVYALELGKLAGLDENQLLGLRAAAILHDIGKLAISETILNKPSRLTHAEFAAVKHHPVIGAHILSHAHFPFPVVPAVLYHHERYDGRGYPEGLKGDQIPLAARILALADYYDALRSDRPYRKALGQEVVLASIRSELGKMFDPRLAELFCSHVQDFEMALQQAGAKESRLDAELQAFLVGRARISRAA